MRACPCEPSKSVFHATERAFRQASRAAAPQTILDVGLKFHLDFQLDALEPLAYCQGLTDSVNEAFQHRTSDFRQWASLSVAGIQAASGLSAEVSQAVARFLSAEVAEVPLVRFVLREVLTSSNAVNSVVNFESDAEVRDLKSRFPPDPRYLNIWITRLSGGLLGVASLPFEVAAADFGVIVSVETTSPSLASPGMERYSLNRTLVHELGHALGLFHTFTEANLALSVGALADPLADGSSLPGNAVGDGAADTPAQLDPTQGNPLTLNGSSVFNAQGEVVMFVNFMDYSDDACLLTFSKDQCGRINFFLRENVAAVVQEVRDTGKERFSELQGPESLYGPPVLSSREQTAARTSFTVPLIAAAAVVLVLSLVLAAVLISRKKRLKS